MGVQRGVNPLAGRCARRDSVPPEKQSGQQSESGRTFCISSLGLTDMKNFLFIASFKVIRSLHICHIQCQRQRIHLQCFSY